MNFVITDIANILGIFIKFIAIHGEIVTNTYSFIHFFDLLIFLPPACIFWT